ncbi:FAST kinase domain-containing protein 3, mitochondrial-like [Achroia grisella]|uniref:FAST kinase domain-containing protein 3, mitochondrial-like n=1 Tax=Achroia grisella TaxID=688607 RepID=UPI0027D2C517|nr:FAST kinase domain-containing protein 3, mitochondrial-like [Achroia grisella]
MALVLRSYTRAHKNVHKSVIPSLSTVMPIFHKTFSDDRVFDNVDFSDSTILVENGFNVQELPVIIRKIKHIEIEKEHEGSDQEKKNTSDSVSYNLIQSEFKQCVDLRDVFSLLTKCTKITPNIALGAMERIYDLEKNPSALNLDIKNDHINLAKGAILDKLLKVVMKTEDTQTILNVLQSVSSFMEPYKYKFCDELLFRTVDNKLTIEQLCTFAMFLIKNKNDSKYSETIDKLWVGFVQKEVDIKETNIVCIFEVLPNLKISKRIVQTLLEQKLCDLWPKINVTTMQDILSIFIQEKYMSLQSFAVVGSWFKKSINILNDDALLDVITKLTRLNYTDIQIESSVEKYMRLKGTKIESHVLIVGVLNYCMQFQIRNNHIMTACSQYFLKRGRSISPSFLKSLIYPFGYLLFGTKEYDDFWVFVESVIEDKFYKIDPGHLSSIFLSYIYVSKYPLKLVNRMFGQEYLSKINPHVLRTLNIIDTALSLECPEYLGPLLPKDQWSKPIIQDIRIKNIIDKIKDTLLAVAGSEDKLSTAVLIPYLYSDETYLIDVMFHPAGLGSNMFNWKLKAPRNENIAILIHLPDHYCSDNEQLVGPQIMRKRHLKILGLKVSSLKYTLLSQFYTSYNMSGLKDYLIDRIKHAEPCL